MNTTDNDQPTLANMAACVLTLALLAMILFIA